MSTDTQNAPAPADGGMAEKLPEELLPVYHWYREQGRQLVMAAAALLLFAVNLIQDFMPISLKETQLHVRKPGLLQIIICGLNALCEIADRIHCSRDKENRKVLRYPGNTLPVLGFLYSREH